MRLLCVTVLVVNVLGSTVPGGGVRRERLAASAAQCPGVVQDVNYNGNDLKAYGNGTGVHVISLQACCDVCNKDPDCLYFSFHPKSSATGRLTPNCHPKSSAAGATPRTGTTSAASVHAPPAPVPTPKPRPAPGAPNVVFLICESIDGRTFHEGSPVPLPNVDKLRETGVSFDTHSGHAGTREQSSSQRSTHSQ